MEPPATSASPRYRRDPATLSRLTLTGVLLLAPGSDEPVLVTTPGEAVWQLLAEPRTLAELAALLAESFRAPADRVRADLEPVLDRLVALGAVQVMTAPGPASAAR